MVNKTVIAASFLLMMASGAAQAETRAFPVPWNAKQSGPNITFTDLPGSGNIRIYTVSGEEVTNISIAPGTNQLSWPVTNSSGRKVASGVYFYVVQGGGAETHGKLVVIR